MRWELQAPMGARELRIHFAKLDVGARYDFVELCDAAGTLVTRWDGSHTDLTTPAIPGDRAQVRFVTDESVTRWGFSIDRIESR